MTELVSIDFIFVDRAKRQRKELKDIDKLADSIKRVGRIIHPPTIERSGELRAGERRWEAAKLLGWSQIEVSFVEDLGEIELQLLEYEENVGRLDLEWQDKCLAILGFHDLHMQIENDWTAKQTGEALGIAEATVSAQLAVARELSTGTNKLVMESPKYSTARGIVQRTAERKKASTTVEIALKLNPAGQVAQQEIARVEKQVPLLHADFHEWANAYTGPRNFNLIHCDFPYGVDADKHDQGQAKSQGGYADGLEVYENLLATLSRSMENVISDSAHLMFWFSMDYYQFTLDFLTEAGWAVNPFPLIWMKNDGTGILPDPARGPRRIYETAFLGSRGDRKIIRAKSNAFAHPGKDKSIHMSEKPVPMLRHFMEMLVDEYTVMLDPTCGSANSVKAAAALGAPSVLGIEANEEFYSRAKEAYYNEQ